MKTVAKLFVNFFYSSILVSDSSELLIYQKTETRCRLFSKWALIIYTNFLLIFFITPSIIHSIVCMRCGNFDTSTWFIAMKFVVPFDTTTVPGWYMALLVEIYFCCVYTIVITALITYLTVSSRLYIDALCEHFKLIFRKVDSKMKSSQKRSINRKHEMRSCFKEVISFHMKIVE